MFSLDDLRGVEEIAAGLIKMGWQIVASDETVVRLNARGIPAERVADFLSFQDAFGFPPTLHPRMESALTQDVPYRIDLVYDITYSSSRGIDVGGLTLLALAAKGRRIPCTTREDMLSVIEHLTGSPGHRTIPGEFHQRLLDTAWAHIARYYTAILKAGESFDGMIGARTRQLLNGENPYQTPAYLYSFGTGDPLGLSGFKDLGTTPPCYVNLADLDAVLHTLCITAEAFRRNAGSVPFITVAAKHGNACGLAADNSSPAAAVEKALFGNPRAIWGGEVICNFPVTGDLARLLFESAERDKRLGNPHWMLDVIAAPAFDEEAQRILGKKTTRKLLQNEALRSPSLPESGRHYRFVRGGFLRQPYPGFVPDLSPQNVEPAVLPSLIIAWAAAFSSNHGGNEIALARDGRLLAVGGGPSTVDAASTAIARAREHGHDLNGSCFAADAFFPFTDAPELLCGAGCRRGTVPAGGKNEAAVRELFSANKVSVVYLPADCRGFIRH